MALWLWIKVGFVNYDTLYALVWGRQIEHGHLPDYSVPLAPTPHPLWNLIGMVLSPLGALASEHIIVALAYLGLGSLGYVIFRLGQEWFSTPVGLLAAAFVLTREPILSYGVRAYVDLPYLVLVLTAVLIETRRHRAALPVLGLLAAAGLLRPEAWLFSGGYLLYIAHTGSLERRRLLLLTLLALSAPFVWVLSDLVVTGQPLWSLTHTHTTALVLHRTTGIVNVPITGAHRLGEILRPDGLVAAGVGVMLCATLLRRNARLGLIVVFVAGIALALVAAGGLPIDTRYAMLLASILAIFAGAAVFGWLSLPSRHPFRRYWQLTSVILIALVAILGPSQRKRLDKSFHILAGQQQIEDRLIALVRRGELSRTCLPISIVGHRPIPQVALLIEVQPTALIPIGDRSFVQGTYLTPEPQDASVDYALDKSESLGGPATQERDFDLVHHGASWAVYQHCAQDAPNGSNRG
ncbi:MAG TPA: hypothetical protein VFR48_01410 [Solirubrobacteraceae bacterium]|nr:hypothetical protein [Solirubrobacteraceae bacterium]